MKKNKFVEGTLFAYIIIVLTKILGALYVIPFYKIIGETGGVLYSYAYVIYSLFLDISTSGVPTALSIIVAEYNSLKMFNEREHAMKVGTKLVSVVSFIAFLVMFIFAGPMANFFIGDLDSSVTMEQVKLVIRTISLCLLVIPFLSVTRGYLQGNKYTNASSSSQLIEQVVRIAIALIGAYVVINVLNVGDISIGVSVALLGTVLGGLAAYLFLKYKIHKGKAELNEGVTSVKDSTVTSKEIIKKILARAIPVIIIAATQNLYAIVDLKLVTYGLAQIGFSAEDCQLVGSIVATWAPKICMIINSIAVSMCLSIIPFIVSSYVKNDKKEMNFKFCQAVNTILYVAVPIAVFILINNVGTYRVFYSLNDYGPQILAANAIVSIFFCIQMIMDMMLQGMKNYKIVYTNTILGLGLNALLDVPMIYLLNKIGVPYLGSVLATFIGLIISIAIIMIASKKQYEFKYSPIFKVAGKIVACCVIMAVVTIVMKNFSSYIVGDVLNMSVTSYFPNLISLAINGAISIGLYVILTHLIGTTKDVFGDEFVNNILTKLKLKSK